MNYDKPYMVPPKIERPGWFSRFKTELSIIKMIYTEENDAAELCDSYHFSVNTSTPSKKKAIINKDVSMDTIEYAHYYHGTLSKNDAEKLLKNDGDFLVRMEESQGDSPEGIQPSAPKYILSVYSNKSYEHFNIHITNENFCKLEDKKFICIEQLIHTYKHEKKCLKKDSKKYVIKNAVKKPEWFIYEDEIKLKKVIGEGSFGTVHLASYHGNKVAVKKNNSLVSQLTHISFNQREELLLEGKLLSKYMHPKIVKFIGIVTSKSQLMIVLEYAANGSLSNYLKTHHDLNNKQLTKMCLDAAEGMNYLSERGIIHRDLGARNCLVSEDVTVKISDFGLSRQMNEYGIYKSKGNFIPVRWTSPEGNIDFKFTTASDVWSFGIMIWEIFTFAENMPYFELLTNARARSSIINGNLMWAPDNLNTINGFQKLLFSCWEYDPKNRPTFKEIENHLSLIYQQFNKISLLSKKLITTCV